MKHLVSIAFLLFFLGGSAMAGVTVTVTVRGSVVSNQVSAAPLGNFNSANPVALVFRLDSDDFTNSANFPTRGYVIDAASFSLTSGATTIGLQNPFPAGQTPYFVIRDNDPAVDGFFVSTSIDFPVGVPIDQAGIFTQFKNNFSVTYLGTTLTSLDLLGAVGSYAFSGLTVFNWTVDDGAFNPVIIDFTDLTIECTPVPPSVYCTAKSGLTCGTPAMSSTGFPSASASAGFVISAAPARSNRTGVLLYTNAGRGNLPFPSGGHILCVATPPLRRGGPVNSGGTPGPNCDGVFSLDMNAFATGNYNPAFPTHNPAAFLTTPGEQVNCQWWGRDSIATGSFMSDAIEYWICP